MTTIEQLRNKVLSDVRGNLQKTTNLESAVIERDAAAEVDALISAVEERARNGEKLRKWLQGL